MPLYVLRKFALTTNFNFMVRFMNYSKKSFESFLNEEKKSLSESGIKLLDSTVDNVYDRMFWYNGLLMSCSLFEEELYNISSSVNPMKENERRFGLERHKKAISDANLASGLFSGTAWSTISDGFKLRHCIMHANGRIDRSRKIDNRLKDPKYFTVKNHRIHLNPVFVGKVQDAMQDFLEIAIAAQSGGKDGAQIG